MAAPARTLLEVVRLSPDMKLTPHTLSRGSRGGDVEVIMGDARLSIEKPQVTLFPVLPHDRRLGIDGDEQSDHPDLTTWANRLPKGREHYYKAINVDAFSSDAIPVHLVTKEAIRQYLTTLTHDGVLCVHTSNRHLDLVLDRERRPVACSRGCGWRRTWARTRSRSGTSRSCDLIRPDRSSSSPARSPAGRTGSSW